MVAGGDLKTESSGVAEPGEPKTALLRVEPAIASQEEIAPKTAELSDDGASVNGSVGCDDAHADEVAFFDGVAALTLTVRMPSGHERTWNFPKVESLLIGSGPSATLRLEEVSVQRLHCLLKVDARGLSVQQLGDGETSVRGVALSQGAQARLCQGDSLSLGCVRLRVDRLAPSVMATDARGKNGTDGKHARSVQARLYWKDTCLAASATRENLLFLEGNALKIPRSLWRVPVACLQGDRAVVFAPEGALLIEDASNPWASEMLSEGKVSLSFGQTVAFDLKDGLRLEVSLGPQAPLPKFDSHRSAADPFWWLFLVVFSLASIAVWQMTVYEVNEAAFVDEFFSNPQKLARWAAYVAPPKKKPAQEVATAKTEDVEADQSAQSEGTKGDPELAPGKKGKPGKTGTPSRKNVRSVGLLGALSGLGSASGSVLSGGASLTGGVEAALGKMNGLSGTSSIASSQGSDLGFGLRGVSGQGQGMGIGSLGAGGMGGLGEGGEGGQGGGGGGSRGTKKRTVTPHRVISGKDVMVGSCEREVIGKAISKNSRQILACYETELLRAPHLKGKVTARFTIEANGRVGQVDIVESTLNDEGVEACVKRRIQRWRFPEPKGGGVCVVNYPWMFQQAGGDS